MFKTMTITCLVAVLSSATAAPGESIHTLFDEVLQTHVDKDGYVTYKALKADSTKLDAYLALLARTSPATLDRNGKLSYWINAYNAFTLKLILNHYPLKSIRDIKKPWDQKVWNAGGETLSLNEIEHEILRKTLKEPRIHFAIVCASIGCPSLWNRAYQPEVLDAQLTQAAKRFVGTTKHFDVGYEKTVFGGQKTVVKLSSIFKWFKEDFTEDGKAPLQNFVLPYVDKASAIAVRSAGKNVKISFLDYDWNLNER